MPIKETLNKTSPLASQAIELSQHGDCVLIITRPVSTQSEPRLTAGRDFFPRLLIIITNIKRANSEIKLT